MNKELGKEPLGIHVLVVDDDAPLVRALLRLVEGMGHVGFGAHTLAEAKGIADQEHLDVAIVDWVLEDCIGEDICAMLRERSPRPSIAILTGSEDPDLPERSDLVGAIAFLKKPLQADDLSSLLRTVKRIRDDATSRPPPCLPVAIDRSRWELRVNGNVYGGLSPHEFQMVECLVANTDQVVPWEQLRVAAGCNSIHAAQTMLAEIRRKLGEHGRLVKTARGIGVVFRSVPAAK
ncbi:MAG: response regulator [Polyangiaceae bacterium]